MQHKYITRALTGDTTGCRQCPGEFREAEYSPQTGSVQSNTQCQDLPPKVPGANTHQPLLLTCRNSCHTPCPGPERATSIHFPSAQLKGRESTPLQNTRTGNRLACQMWQWEKSAEINASSVASSLMRQQFPSPTAFLFPIENASNSAVPISGRIRPHRRQLASRLPVTTLPSW